jgi:cytochrome c oxidase assembly protein subunit 15
VTRFRRLLFFALFLTFDLILFGAFVRVTDAGLGCPDWPGCYGKVTPLGALETIRAEAAERPHGPVTEFKAWVEMLHRYIAAGLGVIVIALAVMATRCARARPLQARADPSPGSPPPLPLGVESGRPPAVGLAWVTLAWIILQGLFGAWTVTLELKPLVVTAHLLGGMILFGLLLAQAVRVTGHPPVSAAARGHAGAAALALGLLFVQIALGGWVSTNYATLACRDFPTCQGSLWPDMDFAAGFELWRRLGLTGEGAALPFQALTAIHYAHRLTAYVVFAVVGTVAWQVRRIAGLERIASGLFAVLALQLATGLTTVFLDWPLAAAVLHTGGAAALTGLLLMLNFRARAAHSRPPPASAAAPLSGPAARAGA